MPNDYIRTDEGADVVCSLEMLLLSLKQINNNDQHWKWVIITLHSAFQGAMVCHLSGTANIGALTKTDANKWIKHFNDRKEDPPNKDKLASARELFKRFSGEEARIEPTNSEVILVTEEQKKAFALLHELRNPFIHFQPVSWSIEIAGLPNMAIQILILIEEILNDFWSFCHADKDKLHDLIKEIRSEISSLN